MKEERNLNREKARLALHELAEQAVPEVDLWPAIRSRLETSKTYKRQGESSMDASFARDTNNTAENRRQKRSLRIAVFVVVTFLLAAAVLLATPQGRAWASNALLFFTRGPGDTRTIPTIAPASLVEVTAVDTPVTRPTATPDPETLQPFHEECGSLSYARCTVDQIRKMVDFPVKELPSRTSGLEFTGATGGPQNAILLYQGERGTLYLAQSLVMDDLQEWEIAANTLVEAVSIGNLPGEYVQGGWSGLGIDQPGEIGWEQESATQTLRWDQDGIRYSMWFYAHKTGNGPLLDKSGMVELVLQLRENSTEGTEQPTAGVASQSPYLTIEQAATRSGFEPIIPGWLPEGYTLAGATYSPEKNGVCLLYRYRLEAAAPSLTLFESAGWLPSVEEIEIEGLYNGQPIDIPTEIQSMEVGGSENSLATWASNGVDLGPICGGIEMSTNKALLWRANGMSFVLGAMVDQFQGRGFLSNLEMRRVAEGLTGVVAIPADTLDHERLASMATLKSLASFPVKTPTRMLAELHFDHAVYREPGNADNPFRGIDQTEEALLIYLGNPIGDGSDGRFFNLFISQSSGPELQTLEETAMGGGYEYLAVEGQPALHRQDCWDDSTSGGFAACMQTLAWFEDGVRYEIDAFLDKALPEEMLIAIAESMR